MPQTLALRLKDNPELTAEYEARHRRIWLEVAAHMREHGVMDMQILCPGARL